MNDLVDFINKQCPDVLKGRLLTCIDGGKIDDEFTGNSRDVETFVENLLQEIEQAPNEKLKNDLENCVLDATRSKPSMLYNSDNCELPPCTISG